MASATERAVALSAGGGPERLLDLRGLRCPWPALRVARALREAEPGATILAVADDPIAPREIAAVAAERGWAIADAASPLGAALRLSRA